MILKTPYFHEVIGFPQGRRCHVESRTNVDWLLSPRQSGSAKNKNKNKPFLTARFCMGGSTGLGRGRGQRTQGFFIENVFNRHHWDSKVHEKYGFNKEVDQTGA